jgi:CRP-like cAMP-binding protein
MSRQEINDTRLALIWRMPVIGCNLCRLRAVSFLAGYELLVPVMLNRQPVVVPKNRLLNTFEGESRARVDPHLERINFMLGDVICEAGGVLDYAYFPDGAVLSLLTVLKNGMAIETANIGREGAFGLFAAVYSKTSFNRCLVQLRGGLLRVPIKVLGLEFERSAHIRNLFVSYSETLLAQSQQTVACNALHTAQQKICRWLLMMHDRADGEDLAFTHDFLAEVLGVNRKSVTLAAQVLQKAGLIDYRRGKMQVLDRPGLEKASCECYAIVKKRFDDFLKSPCVSGSGKYIRAEIAGTTAVHSL